MQPQLSSTVFQHQQPKFCPPPAIPLCYPTFMGPIQMMPPAPPGHFKFQSAITQSQPRQNDHGGMQVRMRINSQPTPAYVYQPYVVGADGFSIPIPVSTRAHGHGDGDYNNINNNNEMMQQQWTYRNPNGFGNTNGYGLGNLTGYGDEFGASMIPQQQNRYGDEFGASMIPQQQNQQNYGFGHGHGAASTGNVVYGENSYGRQGQNVAGYVGQGRGRFGVGQQFNSSGGGSGAGRNGAYVGRGRGGRYQNQLPPNQQWQIPRRKEQVVMTGNFCRFCLKNGEMASFVRSHELYDDDGKTICPVLRKYVCPNCGATGDNAHTLGYCPAMKSMGGFKTDTKKLFGQRNSRGIYGVTYFYRN